MSAVVSLRPESTTADDTLKQKSRDAGIVSGGHLVARALKNEGVDTIFTLCGGHIIDIYDGCVDEGIRIIDVRHEQVAAHAADGYARQTGKLGCVVTTAGPGCTNAVTGIATAFRSESPVLHIGGQGALTQHKMGSLQDLPHVDMMAPITKFAATIPSTERVADMISMAARECFNGAPGPAYLEIPRDVLDREVDVARAVVPRPGHYRASTRSIGDPRDIEKLADILVNAERPAILFGQQVWTARGHEEAIALLRGLDIPGYFNGASRGLLPPGDPHHFDRTRSQAFANADVLVIVGTPFDFRMGYGKRISKELTLVQIDMDYRTVGKNREIDLGLVGDPGAILGAVLQAASGRIKQDKRQARQKWMGQLTEAEGVATEKLMPLFLSENTPIHPYRVAYELNNFLGEDTIHIGDGGDVVTISAQAVRPRKPGQWMDPGALGSLGVGTGFAIAAGLANPGKEVLCYYGDGSFGMTAFDMETANRFGVPYLAVIGNNSAMNQIRYGQLAKYGESRGNVGNLLSDVPFSQFAQMLGGYGEEVRDPAQIAGALQRGRESIARTGKSAVINIWVDPREYAPGTKNQTMYK
ncbi:acetolactate synthase I/II/III large subunit [Cupriavidus gilardii CR3]|uniref:Thiamine pyrophosphate-binding protein n=1 Tax=Cupriavidus gilardii TaxID=82541 RepID=A0A849BGG8_9BURK|nr:thiamine pyrophosphate-binding protein [Cupriavidus gilardii]ALD93305.1 acetolactate synthase I/II/III large subunit [Cupriavidus gilardii CR3]KAB0599291.1 thiamine pyrophosphate-binding protein [Cupriavidus gilardii]MCT9013240.1 thiamine pyrophosphate-binding protein [Cupriavidus gilardii]MCT9052794.1 thiamine pyrophosphate-binding protein [Cupriavidus gilardii]NNH12893.1 thiamine pyrophosphate-binding protein [Cupriavidus gilardii]